MRDSKRMRLRYFGSQIRKTVVVGPPQDNTALERFKLQPAPAARAIVDHEARNARA